MADLPASLEVHNGLRDRYYAGRGKVDATSFRQEYVAAGVTLNFFDDGTGVAQGGPRDALQAWSGLPGVATFAWRRFPNGQLRVRFVRTSTDALGAGRDVRRLQITYQQRGRLLYPVDVFGMKVGSGSYVQFETVQARNPIFSLVRDCPGRWQGQTIHVYRILPWEHHFARAAYARTQDVAPAAARSAAAQVNRQGWIVPPQRIDSYFDDPVLLCSGNPGSIFE